MEPGFIKGGEGVSLTPLSTPQTNAPTTKPMATPGEEGTSHLVTRPSIEVLENAKKPTEVSTKTLEASKQTPKAKADETSFKRFTELKKNADGTRANAQEKRVEAKAKRDEARAELTTAKSNLKELEAEYNKKIKQLEKKEEELDAQAEKRDAGQLPDYAIFVEADVVSAKLPTFGLHQDIEDARDDLEAQKRTLKTTYDKDTGKLHSQCDKIISQLETEVTELEANATLLEETAQGLDIDAAHLEQTIAKSESSSPKLNKGVKLLIGAPNTIQIADLRQRAIKLENTAKSTFTFIKNMFTKGFGAAIKMRVADLKGAETLKQAANIAGALDFSPNKLNLTLKRIEENESFIRGNKQLILDAMNPADHQLLENVLNPARERTPHKPSNG